MKKFITLTPLKKIITLKKLIQVCAIFFSAVFADAMDLPSAEAKLIENFGSNAAGEPLLGDVWAVEGPVFASDDGELIFRRNTEDDASGVPSTLGTWLVIDHADGILSIYGRMQEDSRPLQNNIEKADVIGFAGNSGWSKKEGFNFTIFDRKERRWVNPSLVIKPASDSRPPSVQYVALRNADGREVDLSINRSIRQGRWKIIVQAVDTQIAYSDNLAPAKIISSVNGSEAGSIAFETFSSRDGVLMMYRNGLVPVSQIYGPHPAVEAGEAWFNRGLAQLEIIVEDIVGNARRLQYRIFVE
ncbi:MAG: hypothetical protein Ta2F_06110 [Termitinemataceae bacterium]|nr:MAG: hypothetical protein Ta2F_06110 [Termitinemataceae bacterium]